MSKVQAIRITELEEQLCRVLSAGLKQQKEITTLTEAVETWRVEAATHRRDKEKLEKELADYQANVSESMDRAIAYEAELKADRDHWRKLCQDGWVEVADGPVSRKLREDLASFMMSRSFATGHGDSHTDLLGELGPQIDALRARLTACESALAFANGAINDAIYTEDGLDGGAGQRVLHIIAEALTNGTFDSAKYGDVPDLCRLSEYEALRARLAEVEKDAERYRWLRDNISVKEYREMLPDGWPGMDTAALDAAIDAARGGA